MTAPRLFERWRAVARNASIGARTGWAMLLVLLGFAVSVDFPRAAQGFKGDEATYYSLTYSIVRDRDFAFQRRDLIRVWDEYPSGPEGIFLKKGSGIHGVHLTPRVPFLALETTPDPSQVRLFYGKSYIYPLFAAPFIVLFGTNGFLIFHAILLTLCFGVAYRFLVARGSSPGAAAAFATVFLFASVVPLYVVWLTPELFNFSLMFYAFFLCAYKRVCPAADATGLVSMTRFERFLRSPASDYTAAGLLGLVTFSKPTHVLAFVPFAGVLLLGRDWRRLIQAGLLFTVVVLGLFALNAVLTGEVNYQGGNRKTFQSSTGYPFANTVETFENRGQSVATNAVPLDILVHRDTATVVLWNSFYFVMGRYSGLVPYFFPGVLAALLFIFSGRERTPMQWVFAAGIAVSILVLIAYMPYTYAGGGGPVGNRYYLSFYPLFLFLTPPLRGVTPAVVGLAVGALFTAKLLISPFFTSFQPNEHAKAGPLRMLPIELTQLNDLPVGADGDRARRSLGGTPPVAAYFPDNGSYVPEDDGFWVRGRSRADVMLRAPAVDGTGGQPTSLRIRRLSLEVTNGLAPNHVVISAGFRRVALDLAPGEVRGVDFKPFGGVPYKPSRSPTNYVYSFSVSTSDGFVPFLEEPGSTDSRFLGVKIRITPLY